MINGIRMNIYHYRKAIVLSLFTLLICFIWTDPALAHKVTIFAWIEGDMVHTQSKFSGGKRVMNSPVIVYDLAEHQLLEGKTDDNGEFSFKIPPGSSAGLKVVLASSMGHMADWVIPADEIGEIKNDTDVSTASSSEGTGPSDTSDQSSRSTVTPVNTENRSEISKDCNCQDIQDMIDHALDKKLKPMMDMLVTSLDPEPTFRDIVGGLGYIMGIVGLAMYFMARKKEE